MVDTTEIEPALALLRKATTASGARVDASDAPSTSLQARFEALRNKLEKSTFRRGGKYQGRKGDRNTAHRQAAAALRVVDPATEDGDFSGAIVVSQLRATVELRQT